MTKALQAEVRRRPGMAVIDVKGEINSSAEPALSRAYDEAQGTGLSAILLNLSGVDYINSTGIALIVGLLTRAHQNGRRLSTSGLSPHYVEIFQITRLSDFMSIYPDEEAALAGAAGAGPAR